MTSNFFLKKKKGLQKMTREGHQLRKQMRSKIVTNQPSHAKRKKSTTMKLF